MATAVESRRSRSKALIGGLFILGVAFGLGWWLRGAGGAAQPLTTSAPGHNATIRITDGRDGGFEAFLSQHQGQVVFVSAILDLSVSVEEQQKIADQFQVHRFLEDTTTPLPLTPDGGVMLELNLMGGRSLPVSSGGTGIVQLDCTGYFRVSRIRHAGPSVTYHLREIAEVVFTPSIGR